MTTRKFPLNVNCLDITVILFKNKINCRTVELLVHFKTPTRGEKCFFFWFFVLITTQDRLKRMAYKK